METDSRTDLYALQKDINALPDNIPSTQIPILPPLQTQNRINTPTPSISLKSLPRPILARLRLSIRRLSTKSTPVPISPERPLLTISGSDSSLLSPTPSSTADEDRDDATILLSLLAPLIARLQKLGKGIRDLGTVSEGTSYMFTTCSQGLEKKIEGYRTSESNIKDPHDLEMKTLLLDALSKKIEQERPITIPTMKNSPPLPDDNPLILHSSGVLSSERRSITPPSQSKTGVPIGSGIGIEQVGMYPTFTAATQQHQAGLSNIFRLGSFQNSMLFSPSPVAVRQPATVEPFRV